jgi:hypothetical protein
VTGAGWASELVWTQGLEEKSFASAADRTPVVHSAVRYYTDSAISAPESICVCVCACVHIYVADLQNISTEDI